MKYYHGYLVIVGETVASPHTKSAGEEENKEKRPTKQSTHQTPIYGFIFSCHLFGRRHRGLFISPIRLGECCWNHDCNQDACKPGRIHCITLHTFSESDLYPHRKLRRTDELTHPSHSWVLIAYSFLLRVSNNHFHTHINGPSIV